jgi:hypothetical protein
VLGHTYPCATGPGLVDAYFLILIYKGMSVSSPLSLPSLVCCSLFEEDGRRCCGGGDTSCCFWKEGACRSSLVLLARSEDLPGTRLVGLAHQDDAVCLYVNRTKGNATGT